MKVALCFIISYNHILNKEHIWKKWIESNKDIINVYFHYTNYKLIKSNWIKKYAIPLKNVAKTSYFHVVPAYMSILTYALAHDKTNRWFCMLTDSCVPIISPQRFRELFFDNYMRSIFSWKPAYWNINIHRRANLRYLKKEYHLANDPWFVLSKQHVLLCSAFMLNKYDVYSQVCKGGLANESIFAIMLQTFGELTNVKTLKNEKSTLTDWSRISNPTSPHLFEKGSELDMQIINVELKKNKNIMFLRKVSTQFPDAIIEELINNKCSVYFSRTFKIIAGLLCMLALPSIAAFYACYESSHGFIC
jgi:hypothetical protein